jgi:SAM-dependent methyltransferase
MKSNHTPSYSAELTAFHRAFGRELRQAIRAVPLSFAANVLDLPSGDGFYTGWLARRVYPFGKVTAADASEPYLDCARRRLAQRHLAACIEFVRADAYHLPFDDDAFDAVWCARSLISLDDPVAALREMKRVVRPAGIVAVLEDDEFHRLVVNGPIDLEIEMHRALAEAARDKYGSRAGMSPSRRVFRFLLDAGLKLQWRRTFAADRQAPFDRAVQRYLRIHLRDKRKLVADYLSPQALQQLDRVMDPGDETSLFRRSDAELTCLTTLFIAQK